MKTTPIPTRLVIKKAENQPLAISLYSIEDQKAGVQRGNPL